MYRPHRLGRGLAGPLFAAACFLATLTGVVVLVVLLGSVVMTALRRDTIDLPADEGHGLWAFLGSLLHKTHDVLSAGSAGYLVGVWSTLWLLAMVALFAVPVGVGAGTYLEEYAPDGRLKRLVQTNIANLAGVPSIVYGVLGLVAFSQAFGLRRLSLGYSVWAGALTLGLLVLPVIVIATQEALRAVPQSIRHAALALGANRWQTVRDHVLPSALPGILTGVILALSRAIGETAPLLMVIQATSLLDAPRGPWDDYVPLAVEIYDYAKQPVGSGFEVVASGGILLLLALLLSMNSVAIFLRNRATRPKRA
jgi:phosphate transport system permease protein